MSQKSSRQKISLHYFVGLLCLCCTIVLSSGCNVSNTRNNSFGLQAFQTGQVAQAVNYFQQAIVANPNDVNAHYNLATSYAAYAKQSRNKEFLNAAENLFRKVIGLNDQHVDAHRGLAALLIESGRERYAFDLMNTWKQRYPAATEPVVELARLYQEYGDNRRATDLLSDALKLDSSNVRALKAMGHVREVQGQLAQAVENYQRVLQIDPREIDVATRISALQTQLAQRPTNIANSGSSLIDTGSTYSIPRYGWTDPLPKR